MSNTTTEKIFHSAQQIIFEKIGDKLRPEALKNLLAFLFVIFEKIASNFEIISRNYIEIYHDVVKEEIKLANIFPNDKVLVIGCGSIPSTSVILAEETNTQITALDYDPKAVTKASRYVKKHNLQDKIKIQFGDGAKYPVRDFSVIFVLYGVKNKPQLLKYLSDEVNENTRLIYRTSRDMRGKIQDDQIQLSKLFQIKNIVRTNSFGTMDSFLLLKKKMA